MPFLLIIVLAVILFGCWVWFDSDEGVAIIVGIVATCLIGGFLLYDYTKTETRTIVVESKDRGGDDGSYRVYTDGDTLAVKDIYASFSNFRTDSADLFGDIEVCHRYIVSVRGWEFGLFSEMPNIDHIIKDLGPVEDCKPKD